MSNKIIDFQQNILSNEDIDFLLNLPEVLKAKEEIDSKNNGYVNFQILLNTSIKKNISERLGLDLFNVESIPMRWIKGDTLPHVDRSSHSFEKTFLMYLTDSLGKLIIDNNSYPISKGCGYSFSESLRHETINTGSEPRLLLGPMSEEAFSVGGSLSTLYIRHTGSNIEESSDERVTWTPISWPKTLNPSVFVVFDTNITLSNSNQYFICDADNTIGSLTLNTNGTRPIITINNVTNYPGLVQNGTSSSAGFTNVISNIHVNSTGTTTLADEGGWIGQRYFSKNSTSNIVNCSSNGPIGSSSKQCGGIVGCFAASDQGTLIIFGCSSSGTIDGNSGGIVGSFAGNITILPSSPTPGTVSCISCWSTGNIIGTSSDNKGGGGIFGSNAGYGAVAPSSASATNCYSEGAIGNKCGGIFGRSAGENGIATAENCYSRGLIATNGGGIFGVAAANTSGSTTATNCYSNGSVTTEGNGIYGTYDNIIDNNTETDCYVGDGSWSSVTANTSLTGTPTSKVGETWIATTPDEPYELAHIGYTPYSTEVVDTGYILRQNYSETIGAGSSSINAIISGRSYEILEIQDGNPSSYSTITIDSSNGSISTTSLTVPATYNIFVRNSGSYYMSIVSLEVTSDICLTKDAPILTDQGIVEIAKINKDIHTINGIKIKRITKTILLSDKVILIKKDGLSKDYPNQDTIISKDHRIKYKNKLLSATTVKNIINNKLKVKDINYTKEFMYNIELETYGLMKVNNLEIDTLQKHNTNDHLRYKILKSFENHKY